MSFVSDPFVVKDLEQFVKFCKAVEVDYEVLDIDAARVLCFSDELVEPPETFKWQGREVEMDFNAELHKLMAPGQAVIYRVEYEVGVHPNGEVEYWCEEMIGMPQIGDSNGKANTDAERVLNQASPGTSSSW
jgi:hypothetical protein